MDDQTVTVLSGADIAWNSVQYPLQSLDSNGLLTAVANVCASSTGAVSGAYLGIAGGTRVQVLGPSSVYFFCSGLGSEEGRPALGLGPSAGEARSFRCQTRT